MTTHQNDRIQINNTNRFTINDKKETIKFKECPKVMTLKLWIYQKAHIQMFIPEEAVKPEDWLAHREYEWHWRVRRGVDTVAPADTALINQSQTVPTAETQQRSTVYLLLRIANKMIFKLCSKIKAVQTKYVQNVGANYLRVIAIKPDKSNILIQFLFLIARWKKW